MSVIGRPNLRFTVIAVVLGAWLPVPGLAQPRGDARVWAEERYERWGPFGVVRSWEGGRLHGEGHFFPVNGGAWAFSADASERGQELRLQGNRMPTRLGRLSLRLGDFTTREELPPVIGSRFHEVGWLRGAAVQLDREVISFGLRAGAMTERRGLFGWGRSPAGAASAGATVSGRWGKVGFWRGDWDRQETAPQGRSGLHQLRLLGGWQPTEGWSWTGEARFSRQDGTRRPGHSLVVGGGHATSSLTASAHVRQTSGGFQGLGLHRKFHANEWGSWFQVTFRPGPGAVAGVSADWARDLGRLPDGAAPEERVFSRVFFATTLSGPFYLNTNIGYRNRSTLDPDSLFVDQGAVSGGTRIGWRGPGAQAELAYEQNLFRDPTDEEGDWHEGRWTVHGHRRLGKGLRGELRARLVDRRLPDGRWTSRERRAEARLHWESESPRRGWITVGRERQETADAVHDRDQWLLGAGLEQRLPWDLSLRLESSFFLRAGGPERDHTRWNLRVERRFRFGRGSPGPLEDLPEFGTLDGVVFEDRNGDGARDPGEPGIPGMIVRLGSGSEIETGPDGSYRFADAAVLLETVILDVARIPTRYLAPAEPRLRVSLAPAERLRRDFSVRLASGVAGRVVLEQDGRRIGVPDILVRVVDSHHDVFTDADGRFRIPGLESGPVSLELVDWTLPARTRLEGAGVRPVLLEAGEGARVEDFVLVPHEPEVLQIFRPR